MKPKIWLSLVGIILLVFSCKIREDLDRVVLEPDNQSYSVAVPLVNTSLTIQQILSISGQEDNELLAQALDGSMTLIYTQDVEIPAIAGLDQIEVPDVTVPAVSIDAGELPELPALDMDAGSISLRDVIGDEAADNLDFVGVVGDSVDTTQVIATADTSVSVDVPYGHFCLATDTTITLFEGTLAERDTTVDVCTDDTTGWALLGVPELDEYTIPCGNDDYPCIDTTDTVTHSMRVDSVIDAGLLPDDLAGYVDGDSLRIPIQEYVPPLDAQSIDAMDPVVIGIEAMSDLGFSRINMSGGTMVMTMVNHFPFAISNCSFELTTKNVVGDIVSLGTFSFPNVSANSTQASNVSLAGKYFMDSISVQMMGMQTASYSGPINSDSSFSLTVSTVDMEIDNAQGAVTDLVAASTIESATLASDSIIESFDLGADLTVSAVVLDSGNFNYNIASGIPTAIDINLSIPSLVDSNGDAFNTTIELQGFDSTNTDISLEGYSLTIMRPGDTSGSVKVYYTAVISEDTMRVGDNASFSFGASISGIRVNQASGDFGRLELPVMDTAMTFDIYNQQFSGKIIFTEPSIRVDFSNSFGLPVGIDFAMAGYNTNTGDTVHINNLTQDNLTIAAPTNAGETVVDSFIVDESNNLHELFALPPNGIEMSLGVVTNPDSTIEANNFITDSSSISAEVTVEIPFTGRIEEFVLSDTLDFSIDSAISVDKSSITLVTEISNGFPLGVGMQLIFLDENDEELGSLFDLAADADTLFAAGVINDEGIVTEPAVTNKKIVLTGAKANMVQQTARMVIIGKLRSSGSDQGKDFKLYSDYGFGIKMGIIVNVNSDDFLPLLEDL